MIHATLSYFFSCIYHERSLVKEKGNIQGSEGILSRFPKEIRRKPLFIMIFQKIQHIRLQVSQELPVPRNPLRRLPFFDRNTAVIYILLHDGANRIIHSGLIIKKVETYFTYIFAIQVFLINFRDKYQLRIILLHF